MTSIVTAPAPRGHRQSGMTIVELVVVMVILSIVTTMIIGVSFALQSSYAQTVRASDARSSARDALNRMSIQIRSAQPLQTMSENQQVFWLAGPWEVKFYSSFNVLGQSSNGSPDGSLRLTRFYLSGSSSAPPYQTLWLQRAAGVVSDASTYVFQAGDPQIQLATNVVNASISNTPLFTYYYYDSVSGNLNFYDTHSPVAAADLDTIVAVGIRVIVDADLNNSPPPADLQMTVRPPNAH